MAVVMFKPVGELCFCVRTVESDVSGVRGCGVSGNCILCDGVTSGDGISQVPYADSGRGVSVVFSGGGVEARCPLLSASESAWVAIFV